MPVVGSRSGERGVPQVKQIAPSYRQSSVIKQKTSGQRKTRNDMDVNLDPTIPIPNPMTANSSYQFNNTYNGNFAEGGGGGSNIKPQKQQHYNLTGHKNGGAEYDYGEGSADEAAHD